MGLRINSNTPALFAQRQTGLLTGRINRGLQGLASGLRINRAADDAAGLAISERFRMQVRQYTQEVNNLQTGVNAIQTAEGGLGAQQDAVGRIRELAVQAANGTLTDEQRDAINQEAQQLLEQIGETAENTDFNGTQLLNGTNETIELGTEAGNEITINASTPADLGLEGLDLSTAEGAAAAIEQLDTANEQINENRASLGAQQNRLNQAIEVREGTAVNLQEAESRIRDLDIARATIEQSRNQVLLQSSLSALVQGNVIPQSAARLLGS